jgi:hypothetical protein
MTIELQTDEIELLASLVQRELSELGPEIHHTQTSSYRDDLKTRKDLLIRLLDRLSAAQPVGG